MLDERGLAYTYREYTKDPLSEREIREVLAKLGVGPRAVLRSADAKKNGIPDDLDDDGLIAAMADNPRLLQRPIGVKGDRAVVGRPAEALLEL
ncbi:MAG: arsenate reductase (glutaredoxin) [Alphaproteobacteria bacterium]|nr:arsenate reductase (glutaredoxin) [Alphaproteobacteria bacterium]